ncbi:cysteinyl leukotriene receptor 1-like [Paramacrobiotus metropolitanus]|uniref:cysteinyl leukotriene receptor 1-like n=1 Tax=Paramacrobiotus metropolitanus TaxID=2943436 RepID=UPI0024455F24|nr:cysteinyl leukotriene receptor 1-like [Paramacrobiotus metropolitanus]
MFLIGYNLSVNSNVSSPVWTYVPITTICTGSVTIILNVLVLCLLLRRENSALPFTVYLINLFLANILFVLLGNPLDVVYTLYGVWFMGEHLCTLYLYAYNVVTCAAVSALALITMNRLWATAFPVHYRLHHNRRVACIVCLFTWLYAHICMGPGIFLDALYYRQPLDSNGCTINIDVASLRNWAIITQWINFNIPVVFILMGYFYILFKMQHRRNFTTQRSPDLDMSNSRMHSVSGVPDMKNAELDVSPRVASTSVVKHRRNVLMQRKFLVLTLLTWSNFINLMPAQVYYTVAFWVNLNDYVTLWRVSIIMMSANAALNPILFGISMETVKESTRKLMRSLRRRVWPSVRAGSPPQ